MDAAIPSETSPSRVVELEVDAPHASDGGEAHDPAAARSRSASSRRAPEAEPLAQIEACADAPLELRIEALLMTSDRPLSEGRLAELLGIGGKSVSKRITAAIETLNQQYTQTDRSFRAERLAGGWQLLTLPAFGPLLHRLHEQKQQTRLSQPALETLAIIAYRQPIMRAEVEAIRGVASGEVLRSLLERRLVKIVGRAEELGRPMLYGVTNEFLKVFGLSSPEDLPQIKGLSMPPSAKKRFTAESAEGAEKNTEAKEQGKQEQESSA